MQAGWSHDSAPSSSRGNLGSYFASVVSGGGSFVQQELWCTCSKLRERRSAPTPPFLPPSWQQRKQTCHLCPPLVLLVFPSVYSVSAVALWYYLMLLDFLFMLSPYLFDLSWAPLAQVLLGLHGISVSSVLAAQTLRTRRGHSNLAF